MKANFQLIILIIFIVAAIFGILVFSGAIPIGSNGSQVSQNTVVMWGTIPEDVMANPIDAFNKANTAYTVKYVQKSADTFDQNLLEALASGTGPDIFLLPDNLAFHYANKIVTIPYTSYPLATFKNTFAGAGEIFLTSKGVLAFPMTIDPLMMYYNRSILDSNGIVYPPATWDDLISMAQTLTKKDASGKITQSEIALGEFSNVVHAKDIMTAMFMQTGNPIIAQNSTTGNYVSVLNSQTMAYNLPAVLGEYTDFANPTSTSYSWNKSLGNSDDVFSAEGSAFYFGYASELKTLINKNPNQNFFVAPLPQIKGSNTKVTGARVTGLAISSSSKNFSSAFAVASLMATTNFASNFASATGVPPARRDLLAIKGTDAYSPIFYDSALYAQTWMDPSPSDTDSIWSSMVDEVLSGNMSTTDAIKDADSKLSLLLPSS